MPSDAPVPERVDYDDVDLDDQLALVDGEPFTGIVFSRRDNGWLASEYRYRDGLPEGLCEEWYPDGSIESRWIAVRGNGSSEAWEWHPNGQPRSYRRFVDGYAVELRSWSTDGLMISEEIRDPLPNGATPDAQSAMPA